jgi:choline-sulfatase
MNFLVVIVDQLNPRVLPPYGGKVVIAPHLKRLAETGVVFEHAYCTSPLCAPSRASFMTGRLPSQIGVYDNGAELAASIPTIAHRLRAHGYRTWLSGKMHFVGPDQLHGFERRLTPDIYPAGMYWVPDWKAPLSEPMPWYHDMTSVFEAGVTEATLQLDYDEEVAFRSIRAIYDLAREEDRRPFLLVTSFSQPHDPWEVTEEYWNRYDGVAIDHPAVPPIADGDLDPHSHRIREMCGALGMETPDHLVLKARRAHYASISYLDDKLGLLLDALEHAGLRDDTAVFFMADHGEMLGERGLWYKMNFFEPSAGVPLILNAPRHVSPARMTQSVSLLDLAPTLLGLAGVDSSQDLEGRSLVGARVDVAVSEYLAEGAVAPIVMVRRGNLKFVHSPADPDQLYDLAADPNELHNLAAAPEHASEVAAFRAEVARRWDISRLHEEVVASQQRRRIVVEALAHGDQPSWDYGADGSADRYVRGPDFWSPFRRARLRRGEPTAPEGSRPSSTSRTESTERR